MSNLNISAHAGTTSHTKGIVTGNSSSDPNSLIDVLFSSELDAAGQAILSQMTSSSSPNTAKIPIDSLKGGETSNADTTSQDQSSASMNLIDAMQLAAAQGLLQPNTLVPQMISGGSSQAVTNTLSAVTGQDSSVSSLVGMNNQTLLNVLNSSLQVTPLNGFTNGILGQDLKTLALRSDLNQDQSSDLLRSGTPLNPPIHNLNSVNNNMDANILNALQTGPVTSSLDPNLVSLQGQIASKNSDLNAIKSDSPLRSQVKVSSLSDAIVQLGDAKGASLDSGLDVKSVRLSFATARKSEMLASFNAVSDAQKSTSEPISSSNTVTLPGSLVKNTAFEDKSITTAGAASGFMVNPSFTNHQIPITNLKLESANTSLSTGPLYNEILASAKSGGGRISLEVHPDNAGPVRIDLQIDQGGQARLIVHGASDSTQARLQQGGDQLRQEFAQMGLNLTLDMSQNSSNSAFNQSNNEAGSAFSNNTGQQFDTNVKNSNRISNIQATSNFNSNVDGDTSGINLVA